MIISSNKNDMGTSQDEDEDNNDDDDGDDDEMIITSKLQLVLAAKSRRLQYTSSPVISHHVSSLSLLSSSPDRASVPFSWEEEPGKPKHYLLPPSSYNSKRLGLPPRMLLPAEITKRPLVSDHQRRRLAGFKRWFRRRKDRAGDVVGKSSFVFPSENDEEEDDTRIKRTGGFHCLSEVTKCYF